MIPVATPPVSCDIPVIHQTNPIAMAFGTIAWATPEQTQILVRPLVMDPDTGLTRDGIAQTLLELRSKGLAPGIDEDFSDI